MFPLGDKAIALFIALSFFSIPCATALSDSAGSNTSGSFDSGLNNSVSMTSDGDLPVVLQGTGEKTYSYDANGNLVNDGTWKYTYDDANHLSEVRFASNNSLFAQYFYDSTGKRVKKVTNGLVRSPIYYIGDYMETYYQDGTQRIDLSYYFANGERVARKDPDNSIKYYHQDHLGSTSLTTTGSGAVLESFDYLPFGERSGASYGSTYLYTDQELDPETGLYYYGARYYSPQMMRFAEPDPVIQDIYNPQNLNRYSYVLNNPLRYIDPKGSDYIENIKNQVDNVINSAITQAINLINSADSLFSSPVGTYAITIASEASESIDKGSDGLSIAKTSVDAYDAYSNGDTYDQGLAAANAIDTGIEVGTGGVGTVVSLADATLSSTSQQENDVNNPDNPFTSSPEMENEIRFKNSQEKVHGFASVGEGYSAGVYSVTEFKQMWDRHMQPGMEYPITDLGQNPWGFLTNELFRGNGVPGSIWGY